MTTLKMTPQLLLIISLIKSKKEYDKAQSLLGLTNDWYSETRRSFFSLPDELVHGAGLKKNEYCFQAIELLEIPKEWNSAKERELSQFTFTY
jgi:hypothetical protein